jgi:two-component system response regulator FixJ
VSLRRTRVALVDDDASVRRAIARLLRCAGYDVEIYATADSFLSTASPEQLDCAIVDVRMIGETGLALANILRISGITIPVILMTGDADVTLEAKAARCGAVALLSKPVAEATITSAIEAAITRRESTLAGQADSR